MGTVVFNRKKENPPVFTRKTITQNGTYNAFEDNADGYSAVDVEVPEATLITKTITANGTYNASSDDADGYSSVTVAVEGYAKKSIANTPTAIATFNASALPMPSLTVGIEPVQDLHGYDSPWPAGGGKNKMPSGEAKSITQAGVTISCDGNGVYTINGTASTEVAIAFDCEEFTIPSFENATIYFFNTSLNMQFWFYYNDTQIETWDLNSGLNRKSSYNAMKGRVCNKYYVRANGGATFNNAKLSPMICDNANETTFAPYENKCPIIGHTEANVSVSGANVWDEVTESGIYNISTGRPQGEGSSIRGKNPISVKPNTTYYANNQYLRILFYDKNDNYLNLYKVGEGEFITPDNCYIMRIYLADVYGTTYNNDISINYPSTDHEYHAYNGQTYTTQLKDGQGNPLTCYGGELANENGAQTLDNAKNMVDLGTLNWSAYNIPNVYYAVINDFNTPTNDMMCTEYKVYPYTGQIANMDDFSIRSFGNSTEKRLFLKDTAVADVTALVTKLNGVQLVYPLATPQQFSQDNLPIATQEGVNNLCADSGDIQSGEYMEAL